ncbi:MAG: DUF3616 domain-containing protein [Magnetococcales bacterium]|nr:DUF3616 domain-containing protein [Magnetococcales bacterium]NGZ06751.1 DUF3616 domain-containing protein [Magnetococcales bacterium]
MSIQTLAVMLVLSVGLATPAWAKNELSCPDSVKNLPRLVADGVALEPSGVAWDPVNKVAVGVSDEASTGALFVFDPATVSGDKTIRATPLLSSAQVEQFKPKDLEGITRLASGEWVATASHSLNNGKARDTVLRFRLVKKGAQWSLDTLQKIPPSGGFQKWLTQSAKTPWDGKFNQAEGEAGINVEGLAASERDGNLLFGFRGPVIGNKPALLAVRLEANGTPTVAKWYSLKLDAKFDEGGILGLAKESLGVRDMTPLAGGKGEYLIVLGASGSGSDVPFQLGFWREGQEEVAYVGKLTKGFRAEGITVLSETPESQRLLLVSDKGGLVMECQSTLKKR